MRRKPSDKSRRTDDSRGLHLVEEIEDLLPMAVDPGACSEHQVKNRVLHGDDELEGLRPRAVDLGACNDWTTEGPNV